MGEYTSLAFGKSDKVHISFFDYTSWDLMLATYDGQWKVITLDSTDEVGEMSSIDINILGHPVISYYDRTGSILKVIREEPLAPDIGQVGFNGLMCDEDPGGMGTSISLDSRGNQRVSHKRKSDLIWHYHSLP